MRNKLLRLGSGLVAACLLAASLPAALAADELEGHAAQEALTAFVEAGYLTGYEDGTYAPDAAITRAEFAALVNRYTGLTEQSDAIAQYTDVVSGSWYESELAKALADGYMAAADESHMAPEASVTKQEAAEMLATALDADASEILALLGGDSAAEATRAEVVSAMYSLGSTQAEGLEGYSFVLMNIPYSDFYAAEVENEVEVDAVTSATLNKTRTGSLVAGSYHVDSEGTDITGITFPVAIPDGTDLSAYTQVTDSDSVTISVTNRGTTSETVYSGSDALFENESYAYYVLSTVPSYYKVATVNEDGTLSFGEVVGEVTALAEAGATLTTESSYGDYQISVTGMPDTVETVYAVVLETAEGDSYGLRHMENVWRVSELAWSSGFTESVHGSPMSAAHYEAIMGQTITQITYYTEEGIYTIAVDLYVPVKFESTVEVTAADVGDLTAAVTVEGLPEDFDAAYAVTDANGDAAEITCDGAALTWTAATPGTYTLTISDAAGVYVAVSADFTLTTDAMPAAAAEDQLSLVQAEDATAEDFANFLANISTVSVNGTDYAVSGYGAVAVLDSEGNVDLTCSAFTELGGQTVEVVVTATGYTAQVTLTVSVPETVSESTEPAA